MMWIPDTEKTRAIDGTTCVGETAEGPMWITLRVAEKDHHGKIKPGYIMYRLHMATEEEIAKAKEGETNLVQHGKPTMPRHIDLKVKLIDGTRHYQWQGDDGWAYSPQFTDADDAVEWALQKKLERCSSVC